MIIRVLFSSFLVLAVAPPMPVAQAQSRKPTAAEVAAIRNCATKNQDNLDQGEQDCLFKLVADPCMGAPGSKTDGQTADCYEIEGAVWDRLLTTTTRRCLTNSMSNRPRKLGPCSGPGSLIETPPASSITTRSKVRWRA